MLVTLRTQELHKQYKLLHDDLVMAAGLQSKLNPPMEFKHKTLSVASVFMPMEKIGGDYFDYYIHEDGSISFCYVMFSVMELLQPSSQVC